MKKNRLSILSLCLLLLLVPGCVQHLALYDPTYRGRIVDADTGQPIEGVVVLGVWYTEFLSVAGAMHEYYDARETVTDENGEFVLPGMGARVVSNLDSVDLKIFKVGHEYLEAPWDALKNDRPLRHEISWEGDKPIIPMKRLTMEERKRQFVFGPPTEAPLEKVIKFLREVDKEDVARGFEPRRSWGGKSYD